jgi:hypothetical protein
MASRLSVADVVLLLEGTERVGKTLWRDFVPYLSGNLDTEKFVLIEPCVTGPPTAVPDHVYYYPQGLAVLDQFLTGFCPSCQNASNSWC